MFRYIKSQPKGLTDLLNLITMQRYSNFIVLLLITFLISTPIYAQLDLLDSETMLEDVRKLSHDAAEGRKSGTKGAEAARRYIIKQMADMKAKSLVNGYKHDFTFVNRGGDTIQAYNIISYIKGKSDKAFVITAHYDHVGVINGEVYNGADDNASGVGALLAMIEYFKANKPEHTLVFAALDGEEMGLQGAKAFMKDERIPLDAFVLNINMDMISINDKNELYVAGTYHNPNLKPIIEDVSVEPLQLKFGHDSPDLGSNDWTMQSDHGVFHKAGMPFLYFGVEDHEHYHKGSDEFENINQMFYVRAAHAVLECVLALDQNLN